MKSIELTAKSIEEAKSLAAKELGVSEDQVQVTVLEEVKGLFGKVNLKVRAEAGEAKAAAPAKAKAPAKKAAPKKAAAEPAPEPEPEPVKEEAPAAKPARAPKKAPAKKEAAPVAEAAPAAAEGSDEPTYEATSEDEDTILAEINKILEIAELDATAVSRGRNGRYVNIQLDGKDTAYLIGKHGEVLNAFQYLLNVVANKSLGIEARVSLDGNDYRTKREDALSKYAISIAEQVRERGEEAVLDALPAFERRIVHNALKDMEGIATYSEGEEPARRVVIAPA